MARTAFLASLVVLALAGGSASAGGTAAEPRTLRIVSSDDVDSLDPALAASHVSLPIVAATCAKLFDFRAGADVPRAEVAAGLPRVSADGRTHTFAIRRGFRFSDGTPVTAASYAAAIERVRNPAMRSQWAALTNDITSVRARGSSLTIHLRHPVGDLVSRLASTWTCPVPLDLPPDPLGVDLVPGSGPYAVAAHTPGREIVLRRNAYYRGTRLRRPDSIVITIGGTATTNAAAVEESRFDFVQYFWLPPPPTQLVAELASRHGVNRDRFYARPSLGTVYLALNTEGALFRGNPRLRRAVNLALDRPEILRQGGYLHGRRTDRLLPPGLPGVDSERIYPIRGPDLPAARRLAAGQLRGGKAVLYVAEEPTALRRADVIRLNLQQIGLEVDVRPFPRPLLVARASVPGEPFDLILTGWHAHYHDPAEFLVSLLDGPIAPRDNLNLSYFQAASSAIRGAHRKPAPERYRALAQVELEIMRRQAPVAPLFNPFSYTFVSARVGCFTSTVTGADYGSFCLT